MEIRTDQKKESLFAEKTVYDAGKTSRYYTSEVKIVYGFPKKERYYTKLTDR